jgi:Bacterial protein of unknown function (DUF937)/Putative peptidoglycan binding domain
MTNGQSLLDAVKNYLTPDVMQRISSLAGESPGNTNRAMDGIVPTLLSGAAKLAESPGGDSQLMKLISQQAGDGNILNNLADTLGGGGATENLMSSGRDITKGLFGGKLDSVVDMLGRSVGIKSSTISSLLSIAAPLVLGVLGKEKSARGLETAGLVSLLTGQKSILSKMVPAGLGSLLGWSEFGRTEERVAEPLRYEAPRATYEPSREKRSEWWLWPVLGLAALGLLLYSFWPRRATVPEETIAKRETRSETPVGTESTPTVQEPKPVARTPEPVRQPPRTARQDAVRQSSKETLASSSPTGEPSKAGEDIRQVQQALKNQGQYPGPIDGIMGPRTRRALRDFQKANGLEQTGTVDEATMQKLAYAR